MDVLGFDQSAVGRFEAQGGADPFGSVSSQLAFAFLSTGTLVVAWWLVPLALLPVGVPLAIMALLLILFRPAAVGIAFLWLTYFKLNEIAPALAPLNFAISAGSMLMTVALVWHLVFTGAIRPELNGPHGIVALFWLLATVGLVTARDHSLAYQAWSDYSKTLLLAVAVLWFIVTERQVRGLVRLFLVGGMIVSLATIANAWSGEDLVEGTRASAGGATLSNPNDLALILLLPLSFAATLVLRRERPFERLLGGLSLVLIIYAVVLTQSRGGLLGVLAVFAIIGGRYVKSRVALVAIGVGMAALLYTAMGISSRESGGDADEKGESAQDRIYAWHAGMNMAKTFPLTGVGIGNFTTQFSTYSPEEVQHPITAHSIWFLVLGETGFPGLAVFIAVIVACARRGVISISRLRSIRAPPDIQAVALATLAGLAGYLVSGSFLSYAYQWPLYVLLALTVVLDRIGQRWTSESTLLSRIS